MRFNLTFGFLGFKVVKIWTINLLKGSEDFGFSNFIYIHNSCNLPIFTANKSITNLTQYELSQEESDLLKAGLYFSIQPDKIRKSKIFTTFEKIHRSFLNNLKSEETKSQIKAHLSYLANSYFYNYKPSPRILRQHRVLENLRKNKDIVITKLDKANGVVIKLHYNVFYASWYKELFKWNWIW